MALLSDKSKYSVLGLVIGLLVAGWLILSIEFFEPPTAISFQRLGSLGVVVVVLTFALTRHLPATLSSALEGLNHKSNVEIDMALEKLRLLDEEEVSTEAERLGLSEDELVELGKRDFRRSIFVATKIVFWYAAFEVTFLVVCTLQWGYGDLFVCWAHGEGWQVCY